jgi:hypothetical protein
MGRKNFSNWFSVAPAGAAFFVVTYTHGFTVGYFLSRLRRFHLPVLKHELFSIFSKTFHRLTGN